MIAVKVQYTVKPEYVDQNKANIRKVMEAIRSNPIPGMQYASFTLDDGQRFVHINMAKDQETLSKLSEVKEFGEFREALKASGPISPPQSDNLNLVDAGFDF
jgi:hypothetical protein